MNRIFCFLFLIAYVVVSLPSSQMVFATIINIPDDYPTIQAGIDSSSDGDTVLVQPNTYYENINFNGHNIVLGSLFLITGDTSYISTTIIDGDSASSVVTFEYGEDNNAVISGFTITNNYAEQGGGIYCENSNPVISNNIINGNSSVFGGGICCRNSNLTIINNIINGNSATYGGGICCRDSQPLIIKNIIIGDSATWGGAVNSRESNPTMLNNIIMGNLAIGYYYGQGQGGGIWCYNSNSVISNNTLTENYASREGGAIYCDGSSILLITNTVLWSDSASMWKEIFIDDLVWPIITYCNIQDTLWPGTGNISIDPMFRDPDNGDFHLQDSIDCGDPFYSPCIDAGSPDILDSLLDCDWGLGTLISDMGAYGGGDIQIGVDDRQTQIPDRIALMQNYPNPFNTSANIQYSLANASYVTIDIYDILGRKVEKLISTEQSAGVYNVVWNAEDFSSGVYFYKLQADDYIETKKMVLLK